VRRQSRWTQAFAKLRQPSRRSITRSGEALVCAAQPIAPWLISPDPSWTPGLLDSWPHQHREVGLTPVGPCRSFRSRTTVPPIHNSSPSPPPSPRPRPRPLLATAPREVVSRRHALQQAARLPCQNWGRRGSQTLSISLLSLCRTCTLTYIPLSPQVAAQGGSQPFTNEHVCYHFSPNECHAYQICLRQESSLASCRHVFDSTGRAALAQGASGRPARV
jgi:hypothetical protein